ncbi:DNA polymerase III subunit alpha [bacterium]|nr:DNA polymerase III subunit alpha [candidate division CSSED10-310 bacterium]
MPHKQFVHLHVHSEYSLLDGAIRLGQLVQEAVRLDMPAVALTDHGNMYAAVDFYSRAMDAGVKPIIGQEAYIARGSRFDRTQGIGSSYHLTLLAENNEGYRNLMKLSSIGFLEGFYYKPRVDKEALHQYHKGIIALSGCLKGEVPQALLEGEYHKAADLAAGYREIFGKENFFLEIQDQGLPEEREVNPQLIRLAREMDLGIVACNDCHYLRRDDARFHDILLCIQTGKKLADTDRMKLPNDEFYFKTPDEMFRLFKEIPQALSNTVRIAERCGVKIEFGKDILPQFDVPAGFDEKTYLRHLCEEGLTDRLQRGGLDDAETRRVYDERLEMELNVIFSMGFAAYFLIVWDFINYARSRSIPVGPGRGSAAGSLVAYVLRITDLDPIKYDLLFERFLNPERTSMPDIDVDLCVNGRAQVIHYVHEKYGADRVAQVITFGTMAARAAIRDVGRVLDIPYGEVDKIAKLVPPVLNISLEDALKQEPELPKLMKKDRRIKDLMDASMALEGLSRHASTHAAAVVIARDPLTEYVPLANDPKNKTGELPLTQYSMNFIASLGLLKMDFLGLRNLTILDKTVKIIEKTRGEKLQLDELPLDDEKAYGLLSCGDTVGIFQFESTGMRDYLRRLKPSNIEDLIAMVALYRPGPIESIPKFINCKHGREKAEYLHPALKPILENTYGVIVYQEHIMQIARTIAGFSYGQADILRKAISKKKKELLNEQRTRFITGAQKQGYSRKLAEDIFSFIEPFARYGFNKSHAAPYAYIAYQTAYLKANYSTEYMASLLTADMEHTDKVLKSISECRKMCIEILPPDVNESYRDFTVLDQAIRFGLAAVKNVGYNAVDAILNARKEGGPFQSLFDFCERVDMRAVNRRVVENLIKCGAFDSLAPNRNQLLAVLDRAMENAQSTQRDRATGQMSLFARMSRGAQHGLVMDTLPETDPMSPKERLLAEKESLGFFITGHPLLRYRKELKNFTTNSSGELMHIQDQERVSIAGLTSEIRPRQTRRGDTMALVTFEDLEGFFKVIFRAQEYEAFKEHLALDMEPLIIKGHVESNEKGTSIICSEVLSLEEARSKLTTTITISLPVDGASRDTMEQIKKVMEDNPGKCRVMLEFVYPEESRVRSALMQLPEKYSISSAVACQESLEKVLGADCLVFG